MYRLWTNLKLNRKLLLIAFVPFAITSISLVCLMAVLADAEKQNRQEQAARKLVFHTETLTRSLMYSGTILSGFFRTRDPRALDRLATTEAEMNASVAAMKKYCVGDSDYMPIADGIGRDVERLEAVTHEAINLTIRKQNLASLAKMIAIKDEVFDLVPSVKRRVEDFQATVQARLSKRPLSAQRYRQAVETSIPVIVMSALLAGIWLAQRLGKNVANRLSNLSTKLRDASHLQMPSAAELSADEIGLLDARLTAMSREVIIATERLKTAIENAGDVIMSLSDGGEILDVNETATNSWGYSREHLVDSSVSALIVESERELFMRQLIDAARQPATINIEAPIITAHGAVRWQIWCLRWSAEGERLFATVHDISERKQTEIAVAAAEEYQRRIMQLMPAGLCLIDREGVLRFMNRRAEDMLSASNWDGRALATVLDLTATQAQAFAAAHRADAHRIFECTMQTSPDRAMHLQLRFENLRLAGADGTLVVILDRSEMWQLHELRRRLGAMIAHDIATPLTTVNSTLGMASAGLFGEFDNSVSSEIEAAEKSSSRLMNMFNDLVRFEKFTAGSEEPSMVDPAELLDEAVKAALVRCNRTDIKAENAEGVQQVFTCQKSLIAFLLTQALETALQACPEIAAIALSATAEQAHRCVWQVSLGPVRDGAILDDLFARELSVVQQTPKHSALNQAIWRTLLREAGGDCSIRHDGDITVLRISVENIDASTALKDAEEVGTVPAPRASKD